MIIFLFAPSLYLVPAPPPSLRHNASRLARRREPPALEREMPNGEALGPPQRPPEPLGRGSRHRRGPAAAAVALQL